MKSRQQARCLKQQATWRAMASMQRKVWAKASIFGNFQHFISLQHVYIYFASFLFPRNSATLWRQYYEKVDLNCLAECLHAKYYKSLGSEVVRAILCGRSLYGRQAYWATSMWALLSTQQADETVCLSVQRTSRFRKAHTHTLLMRTCSRWNSCTWTTVHMRSVLRGQWNVLTLPKLSD